jgi:hypothetical protein
MTLLEQQLDFVEFPKFQWKDRLMGVYPPQHYSAKAGKYYGKKRGGVSSSWKFILDSASNSEINDNNSSTYKDKKNAVTSWGTLFTWTENQSTFIISGQIQWQGQKQWTPSGSVRLQYSNDNTNWTTAKSRGISGYGSWNNWGTESFDVNADAQYWRVQVYSGQYGYDAWARIHKLNLFGNFA